MSTGDKYISESEEVRRKALVDFALPKNIDSMHEILSKYRIEYDTWFKESTLHNGTELRDTIELLKEKGLTYELDGALWYKNIEVQTKRLLAQGKRRRRSTSSVSRTMFLSARTATRPISRRISHITATSSPSESLTGR